jgi:hypothetical protein
MSFFQRLADGLGADRLDAAQRDQFVGEQLQGPLATALGWVGTSQADQLLLDVALDLDLVGPWRLGLVVQSSSEALGDEPLADAGDGPWADAQGGDDLVVGALQAGRGVGQQEDAGVGQLASRTPLLDARSWRWSSSNSIANYLSIED